jgi:hypothetical protein
MTFGVVDFAFSVISSKTEFVARVMLSAFFTVSGYIMVHYTIEMEEEDETANPLPPERVSTSVE